MGLYENLETDAKNALKEKNTLKLSVLRMLLSAVKKLQIDKNLKTVEDTEVLQIIQRQVKQHKESVEQFTKGSRQDLVDKETAELKILESYMPKQLSEEEVTDIIKAALAEIGATTKADVGKAMKASMEKLKGRADGKLVSKIVSELLK